MKLTRENWQLIINILSVIAVILVFYYTPLLVWLGVVIGFLIAIILFVMKNSLFVSILSMFGMKPNPIFQEMVLNQNEKNAIRNQDAIRQKFYRK